MKIAMMIVGYPRTWMECKDSYLKKFGQIDTFMTSYNMKYGYHPAVQGTIGDYNDEFLPREYWIDAFAGVNMKMALIERYEDTDKIIRDELPNIKLDIAENAYSTYGQYRKLKTATDMVKEYEHKHGFKYDILIRSRFDLVYNDEPMDYNIGNNELIYNAGSNTTSEFLSDQFFFGKRDDMINISEFVYNEFYNPVFTDSHLHPPHGILRNALRNSNLNKVNRNVVKHLLRKNGIELML